MPLYIAVCESRGLASPPRARFCTDDVIEIWSALSRWLERGREYKWGKSKGGGREDAEEGSPRGGVRAPSCTGSAYGAGLPAYNSEGKRFCFLVTFIWALGDVGVRALHKSGVAVCECRHRDINPGARRLPSGYLFLLLLRLFFVAPLYFPNLFLSFAFPSPSSSLG